MTSIITILLLIILSYDSYRACPECRVSSDFVVPSKYWIEDQEDKEKLIRDYKAALR